MDHVHDALGPYLDGSLAPEQVVAVEAHVAGCESCHAELAALRELTVALRAVAPPDPGADYWARFADRVAERTAPAAEVARRYERLSGWLFSRGRLSWPRLVTAAATCTLLVTLGLHGFQPGRLRRGDEPRVAERPVPAPPPAPAVPLPEPPPPSASLEDRPRGKIDTHGTLEAERPATARRTLDARDAASRSRAPAEEAPPPTTPPTLDRSPDFAAVPQAVVEPEARDRQDAPATLAKPQLSLAPQDEKPAAERLQAAPPDFRPHAAAKSGLVAKLDMGPGPALDSLLARDRRLWPERDRPDRRPECAALATEFVAAASQAPAAALRARAWLDWLLESSPTPAERERWEGLRRSLPQP